MKRPGIDRVVGIWLVLGLALGCGSDEGAGGSAADSARDTSASASRDTAASTAEQGTALEQAATEVVGFLRGDVDFSRLELADTVELYLSPEGGGTRARRSREALRTPQAWTLRSGEQSYSFVPPAGQRTLTVKEGIHFNCREYPLGSRVPALATHPHASVKLEPDGAASCLQTWNATFVFDTASGAPRLVAAVYDQWEW